MTFSIETHISLSHISNMFSCCWLFKVKVAQLCLILCDPLGCTVHGILQARILEWVAFPFSRESSQSRDRTQVSRTVGGFFTSWATRETHEREVYNNYKWSIVFKNCESLYCTPVTYNIVQQLCGAVVKNLPANAGDRGGSIPGEGRSPGGENGNPLQYSCLGNPMDRRGWRITVHEVSKSWTQLSTHAHILQYKKEKEVDVCGCALFCWGDLRFTSGYDGGSV